ncbi:uncharacterized protein CDAR_467711 [Caerostris darwini]|uniref:Uncharacterized protein n=1 Tax=Caerostris darwini TaxID=1538125 RepID=A0AAV4SRP3_9ARAC|nr:uncharacterized protein CDAR_467711 [Caerostris darwini]
MESGSPAKSKKCTKDKCDSPARSKKQHSSSKSPDHCSKSSPEHDAKLWQAKEQVLSMPSPRREYRECVVDTNAQCTTPSTTNTTVCCGPKKREGFSRMAILYFMFFSCVFVVAIIGLRMFTIEDKLLRLDTDYQQQQMRIEVLEGIISQLQKEQKRSSSSSKSVGGGGEMGDYFGHKRSKRETAECICPPGQWVLVTHRTQFR